MPLHPRARGRPAPDCGDAPRWAQHLCHPLPLLAVLLLAVNDHLLKGAGLLPAAVTGKLSDLAGLFFFPLLLTALLAAGLRPLGRSPGRWLPWASIALTGVVFAALKLSAPVNAAISRLWGPNALDPTDLLCLPVLGLSGLWMRRPRVLPVRRWLEGAAVLAAGLATMATSRLPRERVYPRWTPGVPAERRMGCAAAELWVARSGKEGAAVVLELRSGGEACPAHLLAAELRLPSTAVAAVALPGPLVLRPLAPERAWLAFPFDGDASWNAGERRATLHLAFRVDGRDECWSVPLSLAIEGGEQVRAEPDERRRAGAPFP